MIRRSRITVQRLMKWVGVAAVALAAGRYAYQYLGEQQRFTARSREGDMLVRFYGPQRPPTVPPVSWDGAVANVQVAWDNVVFSPEHIDAADLDAIVSRMRELVIRATPDDAEGDLYLILDLLSHARTKAGVYYLSGQRESIKRDLPGFGRPSPGLADAALSRIGWQTGLPILEAIAAGMRSPDWETRVACCRAMGQYGLGLGTTDEAAAALDGLIHALDDEDHLVREVAVGCLYEMGTRASRARDPLIARLARDPAVRVRWQAARALPAIETDRPTVVPALIAAIGDRDPAVGETAIASLAQFGREAREALPALLKALEDRRQGIRIAAASAIVAVAPPSVAVPTLIDAVKTDESRSVRSAAIDALTGLGPQASAALPALVDSLERDNAPAVRSSSAQALARIAPDDLRTIASLTRALKREAAGHVRAMAAEALGQIGPPAAPAVPSLTDSLADPDSSVRAEAETALERIRPQP